MNALFDYDLFMKKKKASSEYIELFTQYLNKMRIQPGERVARIFFIDVEGHDENLFYSRVGRPVVLCSTPTRRANE